MSDDTKCPKCQSTNRAEILWGLIRKKSVKEYLKKKEIVLGGCIFSDNAPKWQCNKCKTRWGHYDPKKVHPEIVEKLNKEMMEKSEMEKIKEEKMKQVSFSKEYLDVFGEKNRTPSIKEDKKIEEIPARIWLKKELASTIGITICSRCGTRTKIEKEVISEVGKFGYAKCPKCGREEKWMYGHP